MIRLAKPHQCRPNRVRPGFERRQPRQHPGTVGHDVGPADRQTCGNVLAAIIEDGLDRVVLELTQLRAFELGIKPGRDRASGR